MTDTYVRVVVVCDCGAIADTLASLTEVCCRDAGAGGFTVNEPKRPEGWTHNYWSGWRCPACSKKAGNKS